MKLLGSARTSLPPSSCSVRVILDLAARKCFDLEVWLPAHKNAIGRSLQSRIAGIFRPEEREYATASVQGKPEYRPYPQWFWPSSWPHGCRNFRELSAKRWFSLNPPGTCILLWEGRSELPKTNCLFKWTLGFNLKQVLNAEKWPSG